jgi:outer membrane protein assembly factor BamE (lipoprotein component of BamABCDE complex)
MIRISRLTFFVPLAMLVLAACTPTVSNRGNIVDRDLLTEIKPGESSREDVVRVIGSPTQVATFDEKTWYYFGRNTKQYSFLDPEIVATQAIEVKFDDVGIVTSIDVLDPALAQNVQPIDRRTPTYGHETTIMEQLVGNLGRPGGLGGKEGKK